MQLPFDPPLNLFRNVYANFPISVLNSVFSRCKNSRRIFFLESGMLSNLTFAFVQIFVAGKWETKHLLQREIFISQKEFSDFLMVKGVLLKIKVSLASDSSLGIECFSLGYLFGCFPLSTLFHEDVGAILQANLLFLISKLGESDRKSTSSSSSGEDAYETKI